NEGLHIDPDFGIKALKKELTKSITKLSKLSTSKLLDQRYQKYRKMGVFVEQGEDNESKPTNG
ncbi:MAG: hypothetical protein RG740_04060, partial [Acholeplasmataceae bacterium]|nr:hypothetical protein [Acholeplasmataceae bacterium]